MTDVKSQPRRYDSSGRQAQARRNRGEILDAAQRQFLDVGYGATTVAAIAGEAGVSVETVYKAFGGKPGLVRAMYDRALRGEGTSTAYERSDEMRAMETDPRTIMRKWGELTAEVAGLLTPIRLLIRAAAETDPDMAALLEDSDRERLQRMRHHATFLAERDYLREDLTIEQVADVLYTCSSLEIYDVLVRQREWALSDFARFVADFMINTLLRPDPPADA